LKSKIKEGEAQTALLSFLVWLTWLTFWLTFCGNTFRIVENITTIFVTSSNPQTLENKGKTRKTLWYKASRIFFVFGAGDGNRTSHKDS
jgi:hypothetical protein